MPDDSPTRASEVPPPISAPRGSSAARGDRGSGERLTFAERLAFSAESFFGACMVVVVAVYLGKFYIDRMLLPAGLFAIALAAGRSLDAITDPVMGYLSDHTKSRWGRRKPWILVGTLGLAVTFYAMLAPPRDGATSTVVTWFSITYLTHFLFSTMVNVPRAALGAELTLDAGERVRLFGLQALIAAPGTLFAVGLPSLLSGSFGVDDQAQQMAIMAGMFVCGYALTNLWTLLRLQERREFMGRGETAFVPGVRRALRNRPFVIMFISNVITAIPIAMPATLMPFFVQYVLKVPDAERERWTGVLIGTYLLSGFVALPLWTWLAGRVGKLRVFLINGFIGVTGGLMMFAAGPGDERYVWLVECYVGLQAHVWLVLGNSMHADVIDYDELHTGKRREAQFASLWSIVPKFAMIPGSAIPLAVLGGVGYVPNEPNQTQTVIATLSVMFALVPAFFNAAGLGVMWWYPLSERRHDEVRAGVASHARGEAALDPITGKHLPPPGQREVDEATGWFLDYFSRRELVAYVRSGRGPLFAVLASVAASLALVAACTAFAIERVDDLSRDPGPLPALAIVAAGLSLTLGLFHALRVGAARRLHAGAVPRAVVERHLRSLD